MLCACSHTDAPLPPAPTVAPGAGAVEANFIGRGPKLAILGDSLTVLEWKRLYAGLEPHYSVAISAWFGEGYNAGKASAVFGHRAMMPYAAARYARAKPRIVVIALGTNDAWNRRSTAGALAAMRTMVAGFRGACLVGVTVPEHSTVKGWSNAEAHALNIAMRSWADQIVDWEKLSKQAGVLGSDGVHTTPAGTALRARAIIDAVDHCRSS